jgi:hypothetical protein
MHAYLFGRERMVSVPVVILLVAVVAANFWIGSAIQNRLNDQYPATAKKYGLIGGPFSNKGLASLALTLFFLWGTDSYSLSDGAMTRLVWSARAMQCLFIILLAMTWFL